MTRQPDDKILTPQPPLQGGEGENAPSVQHAEVSCARAPLHFGEGQGVRTVETGLPRELLMHARELRKNLTVAEELLWQILRNRKLNNWKFRRQHPINKSYILDFYCAETKVAIELDGANHAQKDQKEYDDNRSAVLKELGIRVVRFSNEEALNDIKNVLEKIVEFTSLARLPHFQIAKTFLTPLPPLQSGEGEAPNPQSELKYKT